MMNFDEMFKNDPAKGRIWGQAYNMWGADKLKQVLETVWDQIPGDDEKTIDTATQLIGSQLQQQAPQQASQQAPIQATQVPTQQSSADKLRAMLLGMSGDTQAAAPMHWGEALGAGLAGIGASIQNAAGRQVDVGAATQAALLPYLTRVKDVGTEDNAVKTYLQKKLIDEEAGLNDNKTQPKIEEGINPETGKPEAYYLGPDNKPIFIGVGQKPDALKSIGEFIRNGKKYTRMSDGSEIEVGPDTLSAKDQATIAVSQSAADSRALRDDIAALQARLAVAGDERDALRLRMEISEREQELNAVEQEKNEDMVRADAGQASLEQAIDVMKRAKEKYFGLGVTGPRMGHITKMFPALAPELTEFQLKVAPIITKLAASSGLKPLSEEEVKLIASGVWNRYATEDVNIANLNKILDDEIRMLAAKRGNTPTTQQDSTTPPTTEPKTMNWGDM